MFSRRTTLLAAAGMAFAPKPGWTQTVQPGGTQTATPMPEKGRRDWAAQVPVLRVGLSGGETENDRLGRYGAFAKLLGDTFDVPIKLYPAADYAGVIQAFGAKQIEMGVLGSSGYAGAWLDTGGNVEPLVVAIESDGGISYRSVMVARQDSGIADLVGMKGHSLAWADPNSTSGYLIPRSELKKAGVDMEPGKFFSRTGFGGGHEQAVVAVLQKQYDGAVTWASGIGDPAIGYTRGILHEMNAKGMLKMADLKVIWMSAPILNGPLTVRKDLPQSFKDDIAAFHLALPTSYPAIYTQVEKGGGKGYQRVKHEDFQLFIDLRKEEAANRRQRT